MKTILILAILTLIFTGIYAIMVIPYLLYEITNLKLKTSQKQKATPWNK